MCPFWVYSCWRAELSILVSEFVGVTFFHDKIGPPLGTHYGRPKIFLPKARPPTDPTVTNAHGPVHLLFPVSFQKYPDCFMFGACRMTPPIRWQFRRARTESVQFRRGAKGFNASWYGQICHWQVGNEQSYWQNWIIRASGTDGNTYCQQNVLDNNLHLMEHQISGSYSAHLIREHIQLTFAFFSGKRCHYTTVWSTN